MNTTNPNKGRNNISRRHFLATVGLTAAAVCLAPRRLFAGEVSPVVTIREAAASAIIIMTKLRGNVYILEGSGGNIAVLTGPDGKVLVDAGITASKPKIKSALDSIGPEPVNHLISSHWHFDHTDGNEWLHEEGAEITGHVNTRKHLAVETRVNAWNFTFPPAPVGALPTDVFEDEHEIKINGTKLALKHYLPAHTDSDISIEFADVDILHVADTFWNGVYPFIDYETGGSINGLIRAAEANLVRVTDKTIVIPGHGPAVSNKAQLIEYRDMMVDVRDKVSALKKQGRSLADVVAAKPTADYDAKWSGFVIDGSTFASLVYEGV